VFPTVEGDGQAVWLIVIPAAAAHIGFGVYRIVEQAVRLSWGPPPSNKGEELPGPPAYKEYRGSPTAGRPADCCSVLPAATKIARRAAEISRRNSSLKSPFQLKDSMKAGGSRCFGRAISLWSGGRERGKLGRQRGPRVEGDSAAFCARPPAHTGV